MTIPFATLPTNATLQPTPFKVSIPDSDIKELQTLLEISKLAPDTFEGSQKDRKYGVTNKWIREAKETWQNDFDWQVSHRNVCETSMVTLWSRRSHEDHINSFPNFIVPISDNGSDFSIHFVALFSEKADAIPLVLLHGWPGWSPQH